MSRLTSREHPPGRYKPGQHDLILRAGKRSSFQDGTMNYLTAEELAEKLKVHVKTIYRNRDIPRVEISPGVVRWCEQDVDEWLKARSTRKPRPVKRIRKKKPAIINDVLCDIVSTVQ